MGEIYNILPEGSNEVFFKSLTLFHETLTTEAKFQEIRHIVDGAYSAETFQ